MLFRNSNSNRGIPKRLMKGTTGLPDPISELCVLRASVVGGEAAKIGARAQRKNFTTETQRTHTDSAYTARRSRNHNWRLVAGSGFLRAMRSERPPGDVNCGLS